MTDALYITQKALAARWGYRHTNGITRKRACEGDDFPCPLPGYGRPKYLISDIEYYEKHGTRPKGRVFFKRQRELGGTA